MRPLVLLRPEPGLAASAERARAMGMTVIEWPLFEVLPVAWDCPDPAAHDALLLTSANAVRMAGSHLSQLSGLPVYAVGAATAAAARAAGLDVVASGTGGIDTILPSIPPTWRVIHLGGEDRRAPASRRAMTRVTAYRSVATSSPPPPGIERSVVAVHSPRAGARLAELVSERGRMSLAAISKDAARAAGLNWGSVDVARQVDDQSLLSLARDLCERSCP